MAKKLTREEALQNVKDILEKYWADKSSQFFEIAGRRPLWLYSKANSMFVRDSCHRIGHRMYKTFDFANFNNKPQYMGLGITVEAIEWWHTQHDREATWIECVHNEELARVLEEKGWIREPTSQDIHYYKLTGHQKPVDF